MIVDFILALPSILIGQLISLFPFGTLPVNVVSAFHTAFGYLKFLDSFIPVNDLLTCLLVLMSLEILIFITKLFRFGLSFLPFGLGGKGV